MNDEQREELANILRNFKDEGPRDLDVALDAIAATLTTKARDELLDVCLSEFGNDASWRDDEDVAFPSSDIKFGHLRRALAERGT